MLENVRGLKTHDKGRTFKTIIKALHSLGYGTTELILNSSDFGVAQNRVRLYILGTLDTVPNISLVSSSGAADSHRYKEAASQISLFDRMRAPQKRYLVKDILEEAVPESYFCSENFEKRLRAFVGENLSKLNGYRLIDYRGGQSIHSWELGLKGKCGKNEIRFMNLLIQNRRRHVFGTHQDGKKLTLDQIQTFYPDDDLPEVIDSLKRKGYLKEEDGRFSPASGNMSFEIFKFLDPESVAITLTSSDSNRLGVIQNNRPRRITPRECARLQGFPDSFRINPSDACAYKQFGNSVSVPVIEAVMSDFIEQNADTLGW